MNLVKVQPSYTPQVALEGIVDIMDKSFGSMVTAIGSYFPSLKDSFNGAFEAVSKLKPVPASLINSLVGNSASSSNVDFSAFNRVNVRVPESFTGNLDDYAGFLKRSWDFLNGEALPQMDALYGQLSAFVSNRDSKISLANTAKIFEAIHASNESLTKESVEYFGKNRHNSNKSDFGTAYGEYHRYIHSESIIVGLGKEINPKAVEQVLAKIKRIVTVLDIIIEDAQKREYDKASYEAVKGMATGVYAMAEAMEFYSVTYYRINEMLAVTKENKETIAKMK